MKKPAKSKKTKSVKRTNGAVKSAEDQPELSD